ncbi:TAXI family TRAP transporter solute-binding subunit [Aminobacterium colombiense]
MKNRKLYGFLVAVILLLLGSCAFAGSKYNLTIGTSSLGSSFYILAAPWAKVINDNIPDAVASVQATAGASSNVQLIEAGEIGLAYVSNAAAYEGYNGLGWTRGRKYQKLRAVFPSHPAQWQMVTLNPNLKKIEDIKGHSVSVGGQPGATSDILLRDCMSVMEFEPGSIQYITTSNGINYLKDGRIDAVAFVMAAPTSYIMDIENTHNVKFMRIDQEDINKVVEVKPYFSPGVIPGKVYKNEPDDIPTFVSWTIAIADKDIPEDIIYRMLKAVYENKELFAAAHSSGKNMKQEDILFAAVPLHAGAVRYYREMGVSIPERLLPPEMK